MSQLSAPGASPSVEALVGRVADEFTQRLNRGEQPDVDEYARQFPEVAGVLREVLPALLLMRTQGLSLPTSEGEAIVGETLSGTLGDYTIRREVGRGGMGIVYEAEQVSLGRRVALKVLPFAAALDSRQLQRFKHEAQAAAHLHHTHIVPVYAVGSDRGVHYYAMQFIDGQSLAEVIASLRTIDSHRGGNGRERAESVGAASAPTLAAAALSTERSAGGPAYARAIAQLGLQAADALSHAHQLGIVHRDIKPANLLLDAAGQLWITDFGLSRCQNAPLLTRTGDLVGTLRYMSPEQALGRGATADERSDVYSLGTTLYEALTLEPPHAGDDREVLVRQITSEDPRPPRRLNPAIPAELETVVLKAMAKEPDSRYSSAAEFADDLRRFLEYRPIHARRPTLAARLSKWARRHRPLVAAAAVLVVLAAVGFGLSTYFVWQEKEQKRIALGTAIDKEREANRQYLRAERNFQKALDGATHILMQLDRKNDVPPLEGDDLHKAIEEQGLAFFRQFIDEDNPDRDVRFQSARAYWLMATVYCARMDAVQAQAMMGKEFAVLERLVADFPEDALYRKELIRAHYLLGVLLISLKKPQEARPEFEHTAELHRLAVQIDDSATARNAYAWFLVDCPDPALRDASRAVALATEATTMEPRDGRFWNTLGVAQYRAGNWSAATTALEKSMALRNPDPYDWFFLAMACGRRGEFTQARVWLDRATQSVDMKKPPEDFNRYYKEASALLKEP